MRLSDFLPVADINRINKPLKQIGIIIDKPYKTHATRDLVMQIEMAMNSDTVDDTSAEILSFILDVIDNKLEGDNPDILFVTDW